MRKLNKDKILRIFVTVAFLLGQTVFLLLPTLVINAFGDNEEMIGDGSCLVDFDEDANQILVSWDFLVDKGSYRLFLSQNNDSLNVFEEGIYYDVEGERAYQIANPKSGGIYNFGVCLLNEEKLCIRYSDTKSISIPEREKIINPEVSFTEESFSPYTQDIAFEFNSSISLDSFDVSIKSNETGETKKLSVLYVSEDNKSFNFEFFINDFNTGLYSLIAGYVINSKYYEKKWQIEIINNNETESVGLGSDTPKEESFEPISLPEEDEIINKEEEFAEKNEKTDPETNEEEKSEMEIGDDIIETDVNNMGISTATEKLVFNQESEPTQEFVENEMTVKEIKEGLVSREPLLEKEKEQKTFSFLNWPEDIESVNNLYFECREGAKIILKDEKSNKNIPTNKDNAGNLYVDTKDILALGVGSHRLLASERIDGIEISTIGKIINIAKKETKRTEEEKSRKNEDVFVSQVKEEKEINENDDISIPCLFQGINEKALCDEYLKELQLNPICREKNIKDEKRCDNFLRANYLEKKCILKKIDDRVDCEKYLKNVIDNNIVCFSDDCKKISTKAKELNFENLALKVLQYEDLKDQKKELIKKSILTEKLNQNMSEFGLVAPIVSEKTLLRPIGTREGFVINKEEEDIIQSPSIALVLDKDGDGLSDDFEKRIGTDPDKADSDGDGFSDKEEIKNNYNPLGEGQLEKVHLSPVDKAIVFNKELEQARVAGEINKDFVINSIVNEESDVDSKESMKMYLISGLAKANSIVTLYIYSDLPIVVTVQTDEFGNFEYHLKESLVDGEHEIYVAINDETGKILSKSNPLSFFVKEAKAVSVKDFINTRRTSKRVPSPVEQTMNYYFYITIFLILISLTLFIWSLSNKKKNEINK